MDIEIFFAYNEVSPLLTELQILLSTGAEVCEMSCFDEED
jgi:hypothetical protein